MHLVNECLNYTWGGNLKSGINSQLIYCHRTNNIGVELFELISWGSTNFLRGDLYLLREVMSLNWSGPTIGNKSSRDSWLNQVLIAIFHLFYFRSSLHWEPAPSPFSMLYRKEASTWNRKSNIVLVISYQECHIKILIFSTVFLSTTQWKKKCKNPSTIYWAFFKA